MEIVVDIYGNVIEVITANENIKVVTHEFENAEH